MNKKYVYDWKKNQILVAFGAVLPSKFRLFLISISLITTDRLLFDYRLLFISGISITISD